MTKKDIPFVSVIVLEYNNFDDTIQCIDSIKKSDYKNYQIFLVDNASEISIYKKLVKYYENDTKVTAIRSPINNGYGAGNNYGIKYSNKHNPDYYLIINNDTIVEHDMITKLVKLIEKDEKIGIVFPLVMFLLNDIKSNIINSAGGNFCKFGFANDKYFGAKIEHFHDKIDNNFFFAPGACFLIRKSTFEEINGFDENIFMYWDDVDLSWRNRLIGYDIQIESKSKIYHKMSVSSGRKKSGFKLYIREFAWLYVMTKNLSLYNLAKFMPFYLFFMFFKIVFALKKKEYSKAILKAYVKFFKMLRVNIKQHKFVQKKRKVSDKTILKYHTNQPFINALTYRDTG